MNENMLIQNLAHYNEEESNHGPLGGMAWDQVDWNARELVEQYGWQYAELERKWPALFDRK